MLLIVPFEIALGLILIVAAHELGHFFAAKSVGADPQPPIFYPLILAVLGVTKIKDLPNKYRGIVAAAGPSAGIAVAGSILILGFMLGSISLFILGLLGGIWQGVWGIQGTDGKVFSQWRQDFL